MFLSRHVLRKIFATLSPTTAYQNNNAEQDKNSIDSDATDVTVSEYHVDLTTSFAILQITHEVIRVVHLVFS